VHDNGVGIAVRNSRLYSRQITKNKLTSKRKGTGLGLLLCKDLSKKLGRLSRAKHLECGVHLVSNLTIYRY
jgi:K+-sensing histidine kinase KdpD